MLRPARAFTLLGLLGCHPAPPPRAPAPPTPAPAAAVAPPVAVETTAPPFDPATACAAITHLQHEGLDRAGRQLGRSADAVAASLRGCHPTRRGAWGLVLEGACAAAYPLRFDDSRETADVLGRVVVAHADAAGAVTSYIPSSYLPPGLVECAAIDADRPANALGRADDLGAMLRVEAPSLYDFDGDGEEEFVVRFVRRNAQDHPEADGLSLTEDATTLVITMTARGPAELPGAADALRVEDVDRDGRPDLRMAFPYGAPSRGEWDTPLVTLVAHGLPGGAFSTSDAVAARETLSRCAPLRRVGAPCTPAPVPVAQCGARLAVVVRDARGAVDVVASRNQVICAALRGVPYDEIDRAVRVDCHARRGPCAEVALTAALAREYARPFPAASAPTP